MPLPCVAKIKQHTRPYRVRDSVAGPCLGPGSVWSTPRRLAEVGRPPDVKTLLLPLAGTRCEQDPQAEPGRHTRFDAAHLIVHDHNERDRARGPTRLARSFQAWAWATHDHTAANCRAEGHKGSGRRGRSLSFAAHIHAQIARFHRNSLGNAGLVGGRRLDAHWPHRQMWAHKSRSEPFGGATENGYAFAEGNEYVQQHSDADLSASDSLQTTSRAFSQISFEQTAASSCLIRASSGKALTSFSRLHSVELVFGPAVISTFHAPDGTRNWPESPCRQEVGADRRRARMDQNRFRTTFVLGLRATSGWSRGGVSASGAEPNVRMGSASTGSSSSSSGYFRIFRIFLILLECSSSASACTSCFTSSLTIDRDLILLTR